MARTQIAWGDGTNDYIYLDYILNNGNQIVTVTSNLNKEVSSRTKRIAIKINKDNSIKATLIVTQTTEGIGLMIIGSTFAIPTLITKSNVVYGSNLKIELDNNTDNYNTDTSVFASIKQLIRKFI